MHPPREDLITDALGSVRGVSDGTGALTGSADFDAYGAVRASSGATAGFAFTGELSDPETGFIYLRARYLDPAVGRFGAFDMVIPNAAGTQGFNPYGYVAGNPVRWVDPSGHALVENGGLRLPSIPTRMLLKGLGVALAGVFSYLACYMSPVCRIIANTIVDATETVTTWWTAAGNLVVSGWERIKSATGEALKEICDEVSEAIAELREQLEQLKKNKAAAKLISQLKKDIAAMVAMHKAFCTGKGRGPDTRGPRPMY